MYNIAKIAKALTQQVGFQKSFTQYLAPSLLGSKTGLVYNQGHPLVAYENILQVIAPLEETDFPLHSDTKGYAEDDVVRHEEALYQALSEVPEGPFFSVYWEKTNYLSIVLKQLVKAAAAEVVTQLIVNKQLKSEGKAIWENLKLYEGVGSLVNTIPKMNRFVGFEVDMRNLRDMAIRLHQVGIQLNQSNPALNLYIYHKNTPEPVLKKPLQNVKAGAFSWHELDTLIAGTSGGSFIIGYRESELTGFAVRNPKYDFTQAPCVRCSDYNVRAHKQWSQHITIHPFSVPESEIVDDMLWDTNLNQYDYSATWGLNLAMGVECEITDTIVNNAHAFAEAQKIAVVEKILQLLFNNTRNSGDALKVQQLAAYELNNKENNTSGLSRQKEKVFQALDFNMSGLNSLCFPSAQPRLSKGAM